MNILQAIADRNIFAPWFQRGEWAAWHAFLAALFGLAMTADQLALFRSCTGRETAPAGPFGEAALVIGRRGGKSFILALIAVFAACFRDYRPHLQPGERATIIIVAADRKQARVIMRYVVGLIENIPMLAGLIERKTGEAIDLHRSVSIEVMTASFRTLRGYTVPLALCDELAFWQNEESANPDQAILAALRPAMATMPNPLMLLASSPYARRGELWRAFRSHHARDDAPVLVWKAATRVMNPSVPQSVIDEAFERDPASAAAEYGAEFRADIEAFLSREAIEACVAGGVRERPPLPDQHYWAFVDPSGGSADAMTLAIVHREGRGVILDALRERRPPFSPESVVREFVSLLRAYRCESVQGDRYGGEWSREQFRKLGVEYRLADRNRSELYRDLLPVINSQLVDLLDSDRLVAQLAGLERRTARGGRDSIDHAPGGHDDLANAVAGAVGLALREREPDDLISAPIFLELL